MGYVITERQNGFLHGLQDGLTAFRHSHHLIDRYDDQEDGSAYMRDMTVSRAFGTGLGMVAMIVAIHYFSGFLEEYKPQLESVAGHRLEEYINLPKVGSVEIALMSTYLYFFFKKGIDLAFLTRPK